MRMLSYLILIANKMVGCKALIVGVLTLLVFSPHLAWSKVGPNNCSKLFEDSNETIQIHANYEVNRFTGDLEAFFKAGGSFLLNLGFIKIGNVFHIPIPEVLNKKIAHLNKKLKPKDQIKLKFYAQKGLASSLDHAARFAKNLELPLSTDGLEAIHDITTHFSTIFFPNAILESFQRQIAVTLEFGNFVKNHHPELLSKIDIKRINSQMSDKVEAFTTATALDYALSFLRNGFSPANYTQQIYDVNRGSAALKEAFLEFTKTLDKRDFIVLDLDLKQTKEEIEARKKMLFEFESRANTHF